MACMAFLPGVPALGAIHGQNERLGGFLDRPIEQGQKAVILLRL